MSESKNEKPMKENKKAVKQVFSWNDENIKNRFLMKMWCSFSLFLLPILALVVTHNLWLQSVNDTLSNKKNDRIILRYHTGGTVLFEADSSVSNGYILSVARKVVNLQENWSYLTVEENYKELFEHHSSFEFENFLKANLVQSGFVQKIKDHKMVSTFRWDKKRSKTGWCKKLNAACAIITGTRTVFEDGNRPITSRKVGYLIISNAVYPTDERPNALRVNRLIIEDRVDDPFSTLEPLFSAAKNGRLPERSQYASH